MDRRNWEVGFLFARHLLARPTRKLIAQKLFAEALTFFIGRGFKNFRFL